MNKESLRLPALICLLLLSLLLAGAIYWYRERMLFGDAAWIAFLVINKKGLLIQEHRYGSFITQVFPLAGAWLKLPLSAILLLYSASFNLFYLLAGIILYRLRQYKWLILQTCYLSLIVSVNYFWTNNEVHQGITWMFLLLGYVSYIGQKSKASAAQYLLFTLLAFCALFTHPLVILISGFLWVYLLLAGQHPLHKDKRLIPFSIILCLLTALKYYISTLGWYDGEKIRHITAAPDAGILWHSKTAADFFSACIRNYWILTLSFATGLVLMIRERKWLPLAWTLFCAWAYMTLICMINTDNSLYFYTESEWMSLSIIAVTPLVFRLDQLLRARQAAALLAAVFAVRLVYIGLALSPFAARYSVLQGLVQDLRRHGQDKVIIARTEEDSPLQRSLIMSWALPVETIMLSAIDGGPQVVTAAYIFEQEIAQKKPAASAFLTTFFTIPHEDMNHDYFRYDTAKEYQVITADQLIAK